MLLQVDELTDHVQVLEGEHAELYDAVDDLSDLSGDAVQRWRDGAVGRLTGAGRPPGTLRQCAPAGSVLLVGQLSTPLA